MAKRNPLQQNRTVRSVIGKAASLVSANAGIANDDCNEFDRCLHVVERIFEDLEGYLSKDLDRESASDVQGLVYDIQAVMLGAEKIGTVPGGRDYSYIARQVWEILEPITDELDSLFWPEVKSEFPAAAPAAPAVVVSLADKRVASTEERVQSSDRFNDDRLAAIYEAVIGLQAVARLCAMSEKGNSGLLHGAKSILGLAADCLADAIQHDDFDKLEDASTYLSQATAIVDAACVDASACDEVHGLLRFLGYTKADLDDRISSALRDGTAD